MSRKTANLNNNKEGDGTISANLKREKTEKEGVQEENIPQLQDSIVLLQKT